MTRHLDRPSTIDALASVIRERILEGELDAELRLVLVALRPAWSLQQLVRHHEELVRELFTRGPEALRDHLADGAEAVLG